MNSKNYLFIILISLAGLLLQSCGGKSPNAEPKEVDVKVKVETAKLQEQPEILRFSGKLEAEKHSNLSTRIMGQVVKIYVEPGQKVNQGQLLVQLHDQDILAKKHRLLPIKLKLKQPIKMQRKTFSVLPFYSNRKVRPKRKWTMLLHNTTWLRHDWRW